MAQEPENKEEDMGYNWVDHERLDHRISALWMYQDALAKEKVPDNLQNDLRVHDIFNELDIGTPMDARIFIELVGKRREEGVHLAGDVSEMAHQRAGIARHYARTINSMFLDEDLQDDAKTQILSIRRHVETIRKDVERLEKLLTPAEQMKVLMPGLSVFCDDLEYLYGNQESCWDPEIASFSQEEKINVLKAGAVEIANLSLSSAYLKTSLSEVFMSVAASVHLFVPKNKTPLSSQVNQVVDNAGLILSSASWDLSTAQECRKAVYVMENMRQPFFIFQAP